MDQLAIEIPTSPTLDVADDNSVLANNTPVEPEEEEKNHLPADLSPSRQRTSQKCSSRASGRISKSPATQGTAKSSAYIKSQGSPTTKFIQARRQSKQNLWDKTPHIQDHHSRSLEEEREDASATKDPRVRPEPRSRSSTYHLSAVSRPRTAEDTNSISNAKEPKGQQQTLGSKVPRSSGSPQKTTKASCETAKETHRRLSASEPLSSTGPRTKAEWKMLLEKRSSLTNDNSKYKSASADDLTSREEEQRALCEAALIMGQKRLSERSEMFKKTTESSSFDDYNDLGFNLRLNIFQGGPLESRSLMKDSYTPDVVQKAVRDPRKWHGRRIDELGKWHQKNALNLNLQKALEDRYGKKNVKP